MEAVDSTSVTCESTSEFVEEGQTFKEDVVESTTDRKFPPPPLVYDLQEVEGDGRNEARLSINTSRVWSKTEGETSDVGSRNNAVSDDCVTSVESNTSHVRNTETLHKYASDTDEVMTTFTSDAVAHRCSQEDSETSNVRYEQALLTASSEKETVTTGHCDSEKPHNRIEIENSGVVERESVSETSSSINDNKVSSFEEDGEPEGQDQQISSSYSNVAADGTTMDKDLGKEPSSSAASISSSTPNVLEPTGADHSVGQERDYNLERNGEDQVSKQVKGLVLDDVEEGELDYEEEGEIADDDINLSQSNVAVKPSLGEKNGASAAKDYDSGSEEGEIVSEDEGQSKADGDEEDGEIKDEDEREEGEIDELPEKGHRPRTLCRYFNAGTCRWGITCRFLHPGVNDKGNYLMLRPPGMYPTAFGKPPPPSECLVGPSPMGTSTSPSGVRSSHGIPTMPGAASASGQGQAEMEAKPTASPFDFEPIPVAEDEPVEVRAPLPSPRKETAWERGLKRAKEIKQAALKRREQGETVEDKKGKDFPSERKTRVSPERRRPDEFRPKQPPGAYDERRFRRTSPFHYRPEREFRGDGRYDSRFDGRGEGRPDRMDRDRFQYRGQRRTPSPPSRKYKGRDDRSDSRRERHQSSSTNPERLPTPPVKPVPPPQQQQAPAPPASKRREPRDMRAGKEPVEPVRPKPIKETVEPLMPDTAAPRDSHPMARMVAAEQWRDPWMRTQPPQPKAKSPDLPPLERSGSHSSISSSDSSDSESDSESGSEDTDSSESESDSSLSSVEPEKQVEAAKELPAERGTRERDLTPKSDASKRPPSRVEQVSSPLGPKSTLPYGPTKREARVERGERRERARHSRRDEGSRGSYDDRARPRAGDLERDFGKPPYGVGDRRRPSSLNDASRPDQGHALTSGQAMNENWHKPGYNQQMVDGYMGNPHQAKMIENPPRGGNIAGSRVSPLLPPRNLDRRSPTSGWQHPSRASPKVRSPRRSSPRRGLRPVSPPRSSPRRVSPKRVNSPRHPIQRRMSPRTESPNQGRKGPLSREERPSSLDRSRIAEASRPLMQKRPLPIERGPKLQSQEVKKQAENEDDDDEDSDSSYGSPVAPLERGPEPISNSESDSDSGSDSESGTGSESESEHSNSDSDDSDSDSESENELEQKKAPAVDLSGRDPRRGVPVDKFAQMKASEMAIRDQKLRLVGSMPDASTGKVQAGMKRAAPDQNSSATTSKKEALLRELRAVESAIARKRAKVD